MQHIHTYELPSNSEPRTCFRTFVPTPSYLRSDTPSYHTMRGLALHHDLQFVPTYSPHLNPIEYCFHNWKTEIKHVDQLQDGRTLQQQIDDTRTVITDVLVSHILVHVFQLYAWCIQMKPLEEFQPIGHRVGRRALEGDLQRAVIAAEAEEEEKKE